MATPRKRTRSWLLAGLLLATTMPHAGAQTPLSAATLQLVRQPTWHAPGDDLGLVVEVTNAGPGELTGFRLQISVYGRTDSRSELHESFDGVGEVPQSSYSKPPSGAFETTIPPGGSQRIAIDEGLTTLYSLASSVDGGVYPLTISLVDPSGQVVDALTTALIYYPSPPEIPLDLTLVVPLNDIPARGPDGVFQAGPDGTWPLEEAIGDSGWLTSLLDEIETSGVQVGLAPTPRLIEELADMSDGFDRAKAGVTERLGAGSDTAEAARAARQQIADLIDSTPVQGLFVPYSFPDVPVLTGAFSPSRLFLQAQMSEGAAVLAEGLTTVEPMDPSWLYAPGGRLNRSSIDALRQIDPSFAHRVFFSPESLDALSDPGAAGCPESFATFACPVTVGTAAGTSKGFVADDGLQSRFADLARSGDNRLDLQLLLAETAMIREELPGLADRVVHAVVPSLWHPSPRSARLLFGSLADAPWLETLTPARALRRGLAAAREHGAEPLTARSVSEVLPEPAGVFDTTYIQAIDSADTALDELEQIRPPAGLLQRLNRNVLVAQSRVWWGDPLLVDRGRAYAVSSQAAAEEELAAVRIRGPGEVTLTSRQGTVQLLVFNDNTYPVLLRPVLRSPKLTFEPAEIQAFEPGTTRVEVEVTAQSSGIFPLEASLETSGGVVVARSETISIRSTEFNRIALLVTFGALGFLIIFYSIRSLRRKGRPPIEDNDSHVSVA